MTSYQQHQALIGAADFTGGLAGEARRLQEELSDEMKSVRNLERSNDMEKRRADHNEKQASHYRRQLDAHEKEDAQAIELLRKAHQTIGINPEGARNLIDQATAILNPPQAYDAAAPF
ncbi:hypothetical protein [Corynebacterium sp.]|uniref:hypothetical protein n=1 Tax=Corynebacterium sp. TaxID=1720 RepID=UPI003B3A605E